MSPRALGRTCVALFVISTAFPIAAGVLDLNSSMRLMGIADVTVAALLFLAAAAVAQRGRRTVADGHRLSALRATQKVTDVIPVLLAVYFVAGSRVKWDVLVIGLAWRGWLFVYTLPFLASVLGADGPTDEKPKPRAELAGQPDEP